jgi:hypothetical protein
MVDFNNDTTVGTPPQDLVKILILQARENTHDALEDYHKKMSNGMDIGTGILRARLYTWLLKLQAMLKRKDNVKLNDLLKKIDNGNYDNLIEVIAELEDILDKCRLTMIDTRQFYDKIDIEAENTQYGL